MHFLSEESPGRLTAEKSSGKVCYTGRPTHLVSSTHPGNAAVWPTYAKYGGVCFWSGSDGSFLVEGGQIRRD